MPLQSLKISLLLRTCIDKVGVEDGGEFGALRPENAFEKGKNQEEN